MYGRDPECAPKHGLIRREMQLIGWILQPCPYLQDEMRQPCELINPPEDATVGCFHQELLKFGLRHAGVSRIETLGVTLRNAYQKDPTGKRLIRKLED